MKFAQEKATLRDLVNSNKKVTRLERKIKKRQ
jgi:hypothetical protein